MFRRVIVISCIAIAVTACGSGEAGTPTTTMPGEICPNYLGWGVNLPDDNDETLGVHTCLNEHCFDVSSPIQRNQLPPKTFTHHQAADGKLGHSAWPGRFLPETGMVDMSSDAEGIVYLNLFLEPSFPLPDGDVAELVVHGSDEAQILNVSTVVDYRENNCSGTQASGPLTVIQMAQSLFVDLDGVVVQGSTDPVQPR